MQYNKHNDFEEFREDKHTAGIKKKKTYWGKEHCQPGYPWSLKGPLNTSGMWSPYYWVGSFSPGSWWDGIEGYMELTWLPRGGDTAAACL